MVMNKIVNFLLTLFYIFVIICVIGGVKYYFDMQKQMDERLVFEVAKLKMKYGDTYHVELNEDIDSSKVVWESSNPDLVSVDSSGNVSVHGNQGGTVTITATTEDGKTSSVEIEVSKVETIVSVTGITATTGEIKLKYGESSKVGTNISPSNATDKRINWSSSNTELVTVDNNGEVKAVGNKNGEAIITATTVDGGHKVSIKVIVSYVDQSIKVKSISLNKTSVSLKYGDTEKLKATISPSNATNKQITWTSSNPSLVSVDAYGTLTTKSNKNGEVTITAKTSDGGFTATAKVKVTEKNTVIKATGVKLNKTSVSLKYGETAKLSATVSPLTATNKGVSWTSSDTSLVTVDSSGNIKAVGNKDGTATIVVKTADGGHTASATVKVSKIRVSSVKVSATTLTLKYGGTKKVSVTVNPANAADKSVTWTSSDTSLVTVDSSGNIKAVGNKNGTATVTVKTRDGGYTATVKVTVQKVTIKVTGVKLNTSKEFLKYGGSINLSATVSPADATNKKVTWSSSNTSLVTVDSNGKVTAKSGKVGSAVITVTTSDGAKKDTAVINVLPTGNYVSFTNSYSKYKTNMMLYRKKGIMQSFAIHNGQIYASQQQGSYDGGHLIKINAASVTNEGGEGQSFTNQTAMLKNFGHMANIDIEVTNGEAYLWTGCSHDDAEVSYHCRIKLNSINYGDPPVLQSPSISVKASKTTLVAVDSDNRSIVLMTGSRRYHKFYVYNLDDYISNKENATLINSFQIDNGNYDYHRQGLDVSGNYIYSYEGNPSSSEITGVFLSVYSLDGQKIVSRKKISYPSSTSYWEPEGIKVYNNKIYIGLGRQDKTTKVKTAYIFKMD